jgi:preprotein translocase subunit SecB
MADCRPSGAVIASGPFPGNESAQTMADKTKTDPKGSDNGGPGEQKQVEVQIVGQFIRDMSFESPNMDRLLDGTGEAPNIKLEINVSGKRVRPDLYESAIEFKGLASSKEGTIYDLEIVYAGLFVIRNLPDQALEPFLLINCPTLIFPFLRRLAADITREGGFPPLLLDPIDFAQLYMRRKNEQAAAAAAKPN